MDIFPINIISGENNCVFWKYTCGGGVLVPQCSTKHKLEEWERAWPNNSPPGELPASILCIFSCRKRQLEWIKGPGLSHPSSPCSFPKKSGLGAEPGRDLATAAAPPFPAAQLSFPHGQEIFVTALNSQFWARFPSFSWIIGTFLSTPGSVPAHPIREESARPCFAWFWVGVLVLWDKFLQIKPKLIGSSSAECFPCTQKTQCQTIPRQQLLSMLHLCLPARSRKGHPN